MTIAVIIFAAVLAVVALFAGGVVLGRALGSDSDYCSDEDERED